MKANFVKMHWEDTAKTIATFYFEPHSTFRYEAGQYAVLTVPHTNPDDRGAERTMTLSSSPHEPLLSFTMRLFRDGGSSFKHALFDMKPGTPITIYDAMGDLVLPLDATIPLMYIAGGVGITSFVGMIKWLQYTKEARDVTVFHAISQPSDHIMVEPFANYSAWNPIFYETYLSLRKGSPYSSQQFTAGRLTSENILPRLKDNSLIYISGTQPMVNSIRSQLALNGIPNYRIVFDYFEGYTSL